MSSFDGEPEGPKGTLRTAPLAERMRPRTLDEMSRTGAPAGPRKAAAGGRSSAMVWMTRVRLHDPMGSAGRGQDHPGQDHRRNDAGASFIEFSAVMSGIKENQAGDGGRRTASQMHSRTILFVDEIHRFNKAQQDAFCPTWSGAPSG